MPMLAIRRSFLYFFIIALALLLLVLFGVLRSQANRVAPSTDLAPSLIKSYQEQQAREQRWRDLDAKLQNPGMLLFQAAEFDPVQGGPPALRAGATQLELIKPAAAQTEAVPTSDASYLIVQFSERIRPEQTASLQARGYEIEAYIPNNAFIVKMPNAQSSRLLAQPGREFRWVGAYGAGLKIEPELISLINDITDKKQLEGADEVRLQFTSFRGEKAEKFNAVLGGLGLHWPVNVIERFDGVTVGQIAARRAELAKVVIALAQIEGTEWIERHEAAHLENDNAIKIIQGGPNNIDTPLYQNGLTGAGQIMGFADTGLDTDHAQFRFSSEVAAQTQSFATTTQELVNGALPFQVTNPGNKVLAYYLLGSGSKIDNPNNPNGGKTLDPHDQTGSAYRNAVAYDDSNGYHGTHVVSVAAGRDYVADGTGAVPGVASRSSNDGIARDARIVFQDVGHPSGQLSGLSVGQLLLLQQAYSTGVRVHSQSWGAGTNPTYNTAAADNDDTMWRLRDFSVFFSAGNSGPNSATLNKDTKNGILVARTGTPTNGGNPEDLASSSSHGPTRDGRIKPDIAAPGTVRAASESAGILSPFTYSTSTTANDAAINPVSPNNNRNFSTISGTSFSAPLAAGGAALVRQYFAEGFYPSGKKTAADGFNPSNALIKAVVLNSGRNMTGNYTADNAPNSERASLPSSGQGWGRMKLDDPLFFPGDRRELKVLADIWNGATTSETIGRPAPHPAISTGQTHTYQLTNVSTVEPLRISLVWVDPRATPGTSVPLINDLNLEVIDPAGKVYRGNVNFLNAYSQVAGDTAFDNRNPLEAVYIQYPNPGTYTIKVTGQNVPGNGQMGIVAQPGNQIIDSNRQGYALLATGNFTAGAVPIIHLASTSIGGGVNNDRFVGRNETVTAAIQIDNPTIVNATNVNVQISVATNSQVPAHLVRINGQAAGKAVTMPLGNLSGVTTTQLGFQVTLLNDASIMGGQQITFNVTLTSANDHATTQQLTITVGRRVITYRTLFEPTPDPGGAGIIVIPESDWTLRPDNPNPAPGGDPFAGNWNLTTSRKSAGSTASLGDPSGINTGYGVSSTLRSDGLHDDTRWWTKKILLPGLNVDSATDRVSNPSLVAQLAPAIESFDADVYADFTGDVNQGERGDFTILRVRTYSNTVALSDPTDIGLDDNSFVNLMIAASTTPSTNGFKHFGGSSFYQGDGVFTIDPVSPNNSNVAFRLELQLKRNGAAQTGDGVFFDNVILRLGVNDATVHNAPLPTQSVTVNGAGFTGFEVAPGALVSSFGVGFLGTTNINAPVIAFPLPTSLNGISVRVNGMLAPLLYVGVGAQFGAPGAFQINYQLPFETTPGVAYVEVLHNGTPISSEFLTVRAVAPGVFSTASNGQGQGSVLNQDNSVNSSGQPEARGRVLQVFATGSGGSLLNSITRLPLALATGAPAPFITSANDPLYVTSYMPMATMGGVNATVEYSGLAPGYVGLWQLNLRIPLNAPTGNAVPLRVTVDGRVSNQTTVAIK